MKYEIKIIGEQGKAVSYPISAHTMEGARRIGMRTARQHPGKEVYVCFFRAEDGQGGYLNRNGSYDLIGRPY